MISKFCALDKDELNDKFSDYYIYLSTLGSGSFGLVVQAIDRSTGEEVAIKVIQKNTVKPGKISELKKEAEILSSLNHPNIVKFIHLKETHKRIFLVMEIVHKGSLQQYLDSHKLTDQQAAQVMLGVLRAVDYMHSKNVIHRDIKPENILVPSFSDLTQVKVADFGLSSQFDLLFKHHMENENCGTLKYMAPEQAAKQFYSRPVDLWSCGILMYTLITATHPLLTGSDSSRSYVKKLQSPAWNFPDGFPTPAKNLFLKLVELTPIERYTAAQALNHPWILRQEVKDPLTSFEKFKIYGELLRLKGIVFPIFFLCAISDKEVKLSECKTEEKSFRTHRGVSALRVKKNYERKTPSPDVTTIKRNRIVSPGKRAPLTKRATPNEFTKQRSALIKLCVEKNKFL